MEDEFRKMLGLHFINVLSVEEVEGYEHGYITAELIKRNIEKGTKYYYLCGPEEMMNAVEKQLFSLGITESAIVKEAF